jgi:hypothetical protein
VSSCYSVQLPGSFSIATLRRLIFVLNLPLATDLDAAAAVTVAASGYDTVVALSVACEVLDFHDRMDLKNDEKWLIQILIVRECPHLRCAFAHFR